MALIPPPSPIPPGSMPTGLFVTGTDTDVGKSVVCALLTLGLGASYWKPVQSGPGPGGTAGDSAYIQSVTGLPQAQFLPERHRLSQPLSPHAAAAIDGIDIHLSDFALPQHDRPHLIVEGAGGLLVPLNRQDYILDLIRQLQLPVVLVARSSLGTINHTLLSIEQLRRTGVPILGVVINGPRNLGNREAIAHYGQVPILLELPPLNVLTPQSLQAAFNTIRWPNSDPNGEPSGEPA